MMESDTLNDTQAAPATSNPSNAQDAAPMASPVENIPLPSPGWVTEDGSFAAGWLDKLPEQLADAKPTLGKYRNLTDLAKAHYSLQQLMGRKAQAVVIPNERSTPEEVAVYREAVGIPEKPEGYSLRPEGLPEGREWDESLSQRFAEIAHAHHIPPTAMKALVDEYTNMERGRDGTTQESVDQKRGEQVQALRREWGTSFDKNVSMAQRVAASVELPMDTVGLFDTNVIRALARIGAMMSEDRLVTGESTRMSFGAKAKDIQTNPQNALYQRYHDADPEVVQMVRNLIKGG